MSEEKKILLDVKDLVIRYETDDGIVEALNGVSIQIEEGKTLGLVGETGAGKTTLARGIMRLIQSPPVKKMCIRDRTMGMGIPFGYLTDLVKRRFRGIHESD